MPERGRPVTNRIRRGVQESAVAWCSGGDGDGSGGDVDGCDGGDGGGSRSDGSDVSGDSGGEDNGGDGSAGGDGHHVGMGRVSHCPLAVQS